MITPSLRFISKQWFHQPRGWTGLDWGRRWWALLTGAHLRAAARPGQSTGLAPRAEQRCLAPQRRHCPPGLPLPARLSGTCWAHGSVDQSSAARSGSMCTCLWQGRNDESWSITNAFLWDKRWLDVTLWVTIWRENMHHVYVKATYAPTLNRMVPFRATVGGIQLSGQRLEHMVIPREKQQLGWSPNPQTQTISLKKQGHCRSIHQMLICYTIC